MFWEFYQQRQISGARDAANRAHVKAEQMMDHIRSLESKVDSLALTCQAMWEILRDRSSITEDDLANKVQEIDLRDGKLDGRLNRSESERTCPKCARLLHRRHAKCLYCGFEAGKRNSFQV